jgi:hypothetical protein
MNDAKYIRMDVHTATISAAVRDASGNLVMEATLETKAETILEFVHGLRGSLHVSFEEGTCPAWLEDLLKLHVIEVLVCDSRKNALLRVGNKNDRDAPVKRLPGIRKANLPCLCMKTIDSHERRFESRHTGIWDLVHSPHNLEVSI